MKLALLPGLQGPSDLRGLTDDQLDSLAAEIREYIISTVAQTREVTSVRRSASSS